MLAPFENVTLDELVVRDMTNEDLSDVLRIEQIAHVSPWGRLSFDEALTRNEELANAHPCRILMARGEIIGYHILSLVLDELHILNVVCAPKAQGMGLGHRLMQDIVDIAEQREMKKVFLEVRISNHIAQSLYQKWGFKQIAIRKQYYRPSLPGDKREDALLYLLQMNN